MGAGTAGTNPTLSANLSFCVFNNLAGDMGSLRAMASFLALDFNLYVIEKFLDGPSLASAFV